MSHGSESVSFTGTANAGITADTATFSLLGGKYGILANGTWNSATYTLEAQGADGTTFVPVAAAISANGYASVDLPPGLYKFVKSGSPTAVWLSITRIPQM